MNKRLYVLSLIAAIFLPLGLITGLLGVNVGGVPLSSDKTACGTPCLQHVEYRTETRPKI